MGAFSVSANGSVAYRTGGLELRQAAWFDRSGKLLNTIGGPDSASLVYPEISPDGLRLALDRTVDNNRDVWLIDFSHGGMMRLTFDAGLDETPVWSPDGSRLAFASTRNGTMDLFAKPASGAGPEQLLLELPEVQLPQDWSNDGRYLLYFDRGDLSAMPMTGIDRKPFPRHIDCARRAPLQ
jgi:Tol biopolymer transport system component